MTGRPGIPAPALATAAAIVPAILFPTTYLVAAAGGHVDWCLPPLQGCTDITHTGMKFPESHIFRAAMPFVCGLFALSWLTAHEWTRQVRGETGARDRRFRNLGLIAAIALLIGEMALQGKDTVWAIHGAGATLFFILTYAAVVIHQRSMRELAVLLPGAISPASLGAKRLIVRLLTALLVLAVVARVADWREGGRIAQWLSTYAILAYLYSFSLDWRGYRLGLVRLTEDGVGDRRTS